MDSVDGSSFCLEVNVAKEPNMVDLPCAVCQKPVTVSVKNAVDRGVPMSTIREGQLAVTQFALNDMGVVGRPMCREHAGL